MRMFSHACGIFCLLAYNHNFLPCGPPNACEIIHICSHTGHVLERRGLGIVGRIITLGISNVIYCLKTDDLRAMST